MCLYITANILCILEPSARCKKALVLCTLEGRQKFRLLSRAGKTRLRRLGLGGRVCSMCLYMHRNILCILEPSSRCQKALVLGTLEGRQHSGWLDWDLGQDAFNVFVHIYEYIMHSRPLIPIPEGPGHCHSRGQAELDLT